MHVGVRLSHLGMRTRFPQTAGSDASPRTADICSPDVCTVPSSHAGYDVSGCVDVGSDGISAGSVQSHVLQAIVQRAVAPPLRVRRRRFGLCALRLWPRDAAGARNGMPAPVRRRCTGVVMSPDLRRRFCALDIDREHVFLSGGAHGSVVRAKLGTLPELAGAGAWRCECDTNATRIGATRGLVSPWSSAMRRRVPAVRATRAQRTRGTRLRRPRVDGRPRMRQVVTLSRARAAPSPAPSRASYDHIRSSVYLEGRQECRCWPFSERMGV